ncbi:MAG: amidase, partial [Verrucomicrobiota bacterium]
MSLTDLSLAQLTRGLTERTFSAVDLAEACLARVEAVDERLGAFLSCDRDTVLAQARESDGRRARGDVRGALDGVPVGMKDLIAVKDAPLTCASRMLRDFVSPYDAHVTTLLKRQGAVLFGRLNMDEFAMGSSNENSAVKPVANPWDLERIPGGSSGGSAAAVAAREVPLSLGSDTGGSIRQPAAHCGVV